MKSSRFLSVLSAAFLVASLSPPAFAQVSEDADEVLREMSRYLGALKAFSVQYETDTEIVTGDGQKLQFGASGTIEMRRTDGVHVTRNGEIATTELFYDGKQLTLLAKKVNAYLQMDSGEGIDRAIHDFRSTTGLEAPAADLLLADPYAVLIDGVKSGEYVGEVDLDGHPTHHLAFREGDVDWQLWVRADDHPVPMKYVITTKWVTGAPQHSLRFRDWNFSPEIADTAFKFTPPAGAQRIESIDVNELGEPSMAGAQ